MREAELCVKKWARRKPEREEFSTTTTYEGINIGEQCTLEKKKKRAWDEKTNSSCPRSPGGRRSKRVVPVGQVRTGQGRQRRVGEK